MRPCFRIPPPDWPGVIALCSNLIVGATGVVALSAVGACLVVVAFPSTVFTPGVTRLILATEREIITRKLNFNARRQLGATSACVESTVEPSAALHNIKPQLLLLA
ncbi:hypothetical protein ECG_09446 [Echinococcus granulosus]|uniref:Uncharacterized protein n=1 Tax=Echinococcus granulosus TaxID=6210 RepID=W6UD72_ECHGR|nr:hypothetical protein EGR_06432 [Echinococcus granulosus]EUB58761.1 hypothetical protein EGR_06432 [Echinococcus granulosus]KAH9278023.1 hypothetical protein ECG_09446 [Echinococcus granulosus]